jgi:hypothetical protein
MNGSGQQPIGGGKITTIVGRILFFLVGALGFVATHAQTFTDDFNDNNFDPAKWGPAMNIGAGRLFEQNQRVDFVSTSSSGVENSSSRQWIGQLPVTTNWEATIQIHNALGIGGATNKWGSLGLQLRRPGNTNEYIFIELFTRYATATTVDRGIYTALQITNTIETTSEVLSVLNTTDAFLKLAYDANSGVVTASYDRDASGVTYGWQQISTFGLKGAGGGVDNPNWGLSAGSPFTLHLSGYSRATTIATGAIWADNFKLTLLPAVPAPTVINLSDNFNDNAVDPTKWGTDITSGNGRLFEQNARVDYRVAAGTASDEAMRPWVAQLPIDADWEATIDVHNQYNPAVSHYGAIGLRLRRAGTGNEEILFEHYSAGAPDEIGTGFFASLQNAQEFFGDTFYEYDTFDGSLKMTFSVATKVVELSFDRDGPASTYGWQPLASFGLAGSGGGFGNRDWALSASQKFTLLLYGYSQLGAITNGLLYLDNFSLNILQTRPQLAIVRQGATVKLTWPSTATGYTLQMKNDLNAATWTNLTTPTTPNGSVFEATVNITGQNQFFRLQKL